MTQFDGIPAALAAALTKRGYDALTPVQLAVLDSELDGADALVSAQTGSGKTVAFGLAIAPTLLGGAERFLYADTPLALVVAPTRELALQVSRELTWLYAEAGASIATCVGGMDYRTEKRALERGAHIVVGTPGRLRDHIERNSLDMSGLRAVILDEADEMLDLGFREDLEFILSSAPEERRTLLFSATVPRQIAALAKSYQRDAVRISTQAEKKQHVDIEYRALSVAPKDRDNAIINTLRFYEARNAIVFCATRAAVNHLTARLHNRGFSVVALSGELSQAERSHALQAMRDGRARVCVATDVAARGIDLPGLELVIHADLPQNGEVLLHRSGRTGRAGNKGISALIVTASDRRKAERLLQFAKIDANWDTPPSADEVIARDNERLMSHPLLTDPVTEDEAEMIAALLEQHGPEQLAAGFLRLVRASQSAPEELTTGPAVDAPRRSHEEFGESVWISLSVGRRDNAEPRWLLPMICAAGQITRTEIGAIRVQGGETYVQLSKPAAEGFWAALGPARELEKGIKVSALDGAPDLGAPPPRSPRQRDEDAPRKKYVPKAARRAEDEPRRTFAPEASSDRAPAKPEAKPRSYAQDRPREDRQDRDHGAKPAARSSKPAGKSAGKPGAYAGPKPAAKSAAKPAKAKYAKADGPSRGAAAARPTARNQALDTSKRFKPRTKS
ncbi:DEAD/DEAH box helicase [Plastorhodobacter daqingensis]|uniref:DEAD/DEAH box helicase n=1 Tax=Plastorhodobacter daqingensis TaxID=1387281 RepID=A0ABW2UJU7_9RHOB